MTVAEIISQAQALTRESLSIPTSTYLAWMNRINRKYCRSDNWPELRVLNATLTTVASQAGYDLPATFSRIMGEFVSWNATAITGGFQYGTQIPFLNQGNVENDRRIGQWTQTGGGFGALNPQVCYIEPKSGTPTTKQLVFAPFPATAGITIVYNYYRQPADFAATSESITVPTLEDTFVMALCKQLMMYLGNSDGVLMYAGLEKTEFRAAKTILIAQ